MNLEPSIAIKPNTVCIHVGRFHWFARHVPTTCDDKRDFILLSEFYVSEVKINIDSQGKRQHYSREERLFSRVL